MWWYLVFSSPTYTRVAATALAFWLCMQCISEGFVRAVLNVGCYGSLGVFGICWDMCSESCTSQFISSVAIWSSRVFRRLCLGYLFLFPAHHSLFNTSWFLSTSSERLASESRRRLVCGGGVRRNTFSTVGTSPFVVEREHLEGTLESTL